MSIGWENQMILILQGVSAFMVVQNLMTLLLYTGTYLVTGLIAGYWIWGVFMLSLYAFGFVQAALFIIWVLRGTPVPRAYIVDTFTLSLAALSATYWYLVQPIALNAWLGQYYLPVLGINVAILAFRGLVFVRSREGASATPVRD